MLSDLIDKYRRYTLKLVAPFGSRARGDYTDDSDIDLLVVADDLPKNPREGSTFILEVLEDGKILYAEEEFLNEVMDSYRDVRKRYIRRGRTWVRLITS
ncbi:MAG: nucleotidyltransferase domain-containing protein [Zestosphaera sp.]